MRNLNEVVIIGGGFSGVALAAELLRRRVRLGITIVESGDELGRGLAYSTPVSSHLLNTRANQMSVHTNDPEHFVRWSRRRGFAVHGPEFLPRRAYGEYLEASLQDLCSSASPAQMTVHMQAGALDVVPKGERFEIRLEGGRTLSTDAVVIATGHPAPADPFGGSLPDDTWRYLRNPWLRDGYDAIRAPDRVLLVGTGLTAVDAVLALEHAGHGGPIHAVSRHGLLPRRHRVRPQSLPADLQVELVAGLARKNLRAITATVRRVAAMADERGIAGWQAVVDALRPVTPKIWSELCPSDRGRFVRWLRPFWDAHRHRLPPVVAGQLAALQADGRLDVRAARLRGARDHGDAITVEYEVRGTAKRVRERYDWVINCTGSSFATEAARPLERRLLERGLLLVDPLRLGYITCDAGTAIGTRGPVDQLYVLGPACRANFWEHTAVPELRAQAARIADRLLGTSTHSYAALRGDAREALGAH